MTQDKNLAVQNNPEAEYAVYIFHDLAHINDNHIAYISWEKRHTTSSVLSAYRAARSLYESRSYRRVEIKKNFFDKNLGRKIYKTLKIYDKDEYKPVGIFSIFLVIFLLSVACFFYLI